MTANNCAEIPFVPDLSETIEQVAAEPAQAQGDGQSATNQPLPDLIAADRYLAGKTAAARTNARGGSTSPWNLLRPARARTEGTGGGDGGDCE